MNTGACPTTCPPYWVASASYTARCPNEDTMLWGWMPAGTKTLSGAVLLRTSPTLDFLVAHDYSPNGALRFSILQFTEGVLTDNNALPWLPSPVVPDPNTVGNVEGLAQWKDDRFMAVNGDGEVYTMEISTFGDSIKCVGFSLLPGSAPGDEIEGFAIWRQPGLNLCIWATRGGPGTPAVISCGTVIVDGLIANAPGTVDFTTPFPTTNQRHIAGLHVADNGDVYAASNSDPGNNGPFTSAVYKIGVLSAVGDVANFTLDGPTEIYRSLNHKSEAIMGVPGDQTGLGLILASDDENFGGSIYLQYAPIARHITVSRTARSYISLEDAHTRARILAKREAVGELKCYVQNIQSRPPYCTGDYYDPVRRIAWSDSSPAQAQDDALAGASTAAQEWCYSNFDQEPPPIINGEPTDDLVEALIDEGGSLLIDDATGLVFQNE